MSEHDCQHPIEEDQPGILTWTCPECFRVWEARTSIWWAPAEDDRGQYVYRRPNSDDPRSHHPDLFPDTARERGYAAVWEIVNRYPMGTGNALISNYAIIWQAVHAFADAALGVKEPT